MRCLYAIEFSGGLFKLGRTTNLPLRIKSHRADPRAHGQTYLRHWSREWDDIVRAEFFPTVMGHYAGGHDLFTSREWQTGIDFDYLTGHMDMYLHDVTATGTYLDVDVWLDIHSFQPASGYFTPNPRLAEARS